jgi:hypothetical protein
MRLFGIRDIGEIQANGCAHAFLAFQNHMATRLVDETVHHRQAQAAALANIAGGEEGFKHTVLMLWWNADAGILYGHDNIFTWFNVGGFKFVIGQDCAVFGANSQDAALGHGMACVQRQVQHRIFQLPGINMNEVQMVLEVGFNVNGRFKRTAHHDDQVIKALVHIDRFGPQHLLPGKGEQLLG